MSRSRFNTFLKQWVVPPGFTAARRGRQRRDLQKFWSGADVAAPPYETAAFASAGVPAATITRDDDSRNCGRIDRTARLPLPEGAAGEAVQTAITATGPWPEGASVRLTVGGQETTHVALSDRLWLDVRLDVPAGATHLEVSVDAPVHMAAPRAVRVRAARRPGLNHVIVLVLDAWTPRLARPDHPTEPGTPLTPNIDRFFAGGFAAPNGYSSAEWTMPTSASFFTGLSTARHRVFHPYAATQLPADRPLLAERFQAAGYHTLAMSVANRLTPAYGHHRGFDRFIYHFPEPGFTQRRYDTAVWLAELIGHLDAHRRDRTFSYVHLPDVHPVWEIPPITRSFNLGRRGSSTGLALTALRKTAEADEQGRQLYALRLRELDRQLGTLFDYIERCANDETLVVLTADHGTPWHFVRPQRAKDEPFLVDDRTAIELRMRGPGVPAGRRETLVAPTLDLMPTVLARAGLDVPGDLDGRDLLDPSYTRDHVLSESVYGGVYEIAVRDGARTYIERHPVDESQLRLTGPPMTQALYRAETRDYRSPLTEAPGRLGEIAKAHIDRYWRKESAA